MLLFVGQQSKLIETQKKIMILKWFVLYNDCNENLHAYARAAFHCLPFEKILLKVKTW